MNFRFGSWLSDLLSPLPVCCSIWQLRCC